MESRIHFTQREQQNTLQSHLLVPVSINGRSPLPFCVEPSRSRTLVSARTIETMGLSVDDSLSTLTISERLAYHSMIASMAHDGWLPNGQSLASSRFARSFGRDGWAAPNYNFKVVQHCTAESDGL